MNGQAKVFNEKLKELIEQLDELSDDQASDDSSAAITFADGSVTRINNIDCQRILQSVAAIDKLCDLILACQSNLTETSIELYNLTLPEEVLFKLEERLAIVEEL